MASHHDHHATDTSKSLRNVIFFLVLFFGLTVAGHYLFVAGGHHAETGSHGGEHAPEPGHE